VNVGKSNVAAVLKHHTAMSYAVWEQTHTLNPDKKWKCVISFRFQPLFSLGEIAIGIYCKEGRVNPRVDMGAVAKWKSLLQ
jgi:hypothetical protein